MVSIKCHFGGFRPSIQAPAVLYHAGSLPQHFRAIGNAKDGTPLIDMQVDLSRYPLAQVPATSATNALELHRSLERLTNISAAKKGARNTVGVILADTWEGHPTVFGMMFDVGFEAYELGSLGPFQKVSREGCAVFVDSIRRYRKDASEQDIEKQIAWTTVHELGHVFNLWHHHSPVRSMTPSSPSRIYGKYPGDQFAFLDIQCEFLRICLEDGLSGPGAIYAWPGGVPFGTRGKWTPSKEFYSTHDNPESRKALRLEIEMEQKSFWLFEPVELDLRVRVAPGVTTKYRLPDTLDPGYETFQVWIEEPDGSRRRYRSPRLYCGALATNAVSDAETMERDLSIFGESGGYTFRASGRHRLWVTWLISPRRVLRSNIIEVEVRGVLDDPRQASEVMRILTKRSVASMLYHRTVPPRREIIEPVLELALKEKGTPLEVNLRYAVGRVLAVRARRGRDTGGRHAMAARDQLSRVLDRGASRRRMFHAARIVDELSQ